MRIIRNVNKEVRKFKPFNPQVSFSIEMLWDDLPTISFLPIDAMLKSKPQI